MSTTNANEAGPVGAVGSVLAVPATGLEIKQIPDLAVKLAASDVEVSRTAKRAMWQIVRNVGRPSADTERQAAVAELVPLLRQGQPEIVYREVLWMLSEIGSDESVGPIAALLANHVTREDARMVLERISGEKSLAALKKSLGAASDDFKVSLAQSLRARGVEVPDVPCVKLKPTKPTTVRPVG